MWVDVLIILALVLLNGLLSGAEIATVTLRKTRLQELVEAGKSSARAVARLRAQPERFLATVQIGITVIGAAAGAYGGEKIAAQLSPLLGGIPVVGPVLQPWAHSIAFVVVVASISYLSLVLGELVPKSLALRATESYALVVGRPLLYLSQVARPVVWFLTASSNVVLRLFGDRTSFTEARISPDELKAMLEEASVGGSIDPRAGEIAARAIELAELVAVDVMVPRRRIVAVERVAGLQEVRRAIAESGHSRIPVYDDTIDNIVGYVAARDAYTRIDASVDELLRAPAFIPEQMKAIDVLQQLRERAAHLAIVVDEHGGTAGLLTREDLVEEVMGEMLSEHVKAASSEAELRVDADGSAVVSGLALVRDVNRVLDFELPESDEWTTVSGMCVGIAGRIPTAGERIEAPGGNVVVVLEASPRRVRSVRVLPAPPRDQPGP